MWKRKNPLDEKLQWYLGYILAYFCNILTCQEWGSQKKKKKDFTNITIFELRENNNLL